MTGETNLAELIKSMNPRLNDGEYVFVTIDDCNLLDRKETICEFKEKEGTTIVLEKNIADQYKLQYEFISSWITLEIHSSLFAVGLTAAFSTELAKNNISCNVIAGYYHDHIFIPKQEAEKAMMVLKNLAESTTS